MQKYNFFKQDALRPTEKQRLLTSLEIYARFDDWKDIDKFYFIPLYMEMTYSCGWVAEMASDPVWLGSCPLHLGAPGAVPVPLPSLQLQIYVNSMGLRCILPMDFIYFITDATIEMPFPVQRLVAKNCYDACVFRYICASTFSIRTMLKQLNITNFRCYEKSTIHFNGTSILVGRNNAGKSTMIEALKIISSVTRKYKTLRFTAPPEWVSKESDYGVSPNVENMNISDRGLFYMYGNPPAVIEAFFSNGSSIKAYVGEGLDIFATITDQDGCSVRNTREAKNANIPVIEVLPQISAVLDNEKVLKKTTVDGNRSTRLASRNFRNQLFYYQESFPVFQKLSEMTWEGLKVNPVESIFTDEGRMLQFFLRVGNFEAEIGWMGHGLQMWVQTMWFISQCSECDIVVLDEPDVYMHADLQRRLVRFITPLFAQIIIATHSLEIIEEVPSECIIPIDSHRRTIKTIGDEAPLHKLAEELGSPLNIDLARLFVSNKFIVWDCDDAGRKVLSAFQSVLYPQDLHPIITFPKSLVEGWNGWKKAVAVAEVFSMNHMPVQLYCIFDSNYHTADDIRERRKEAKHLKINLHIWDKKEIENYAINTDVILRYLTACKQKGIVAWGTLQDQISSILQEMKEDVMNAITVAIQQNMTGQSEQAQEDAWEELTARWAEPTDLVPGKLFFNRLSFWTLENYGISISARQVIPYFKPDEVPYEIKIVIDAIMDGKPL